MSAPRVGMRSVWFGDGPNDDRGACGTIVRVAKVQDPHAEFECGILWDDGEEVTHFWPNRAWFPVDVADAKREARREAFEQAAKICKDRENYCRATAWPAFADDAHVACELHDEICKLAESTEE